MSATIDSAADATPPEDLRSQLSAAFDQAEAPPERAPPARETPSADAVSPSAAETEGATPADGRARGPDGKFVKAEGEAPEPAAKAVPRQEATPEPAAPSEPAIKAPANWAPQHREMLAKLPADAQQFLIDRHRDMEADYTRKTTEIAGLRRDWEPVAQMFAPHADMMRQKGLTPATTIQAWYNVEQDLMSGGPKAADTVIGILRGYNVDPRDVLQRLGFQMPAGGPAVPAAPAPEGGAPPPQLPPEVVQKLNGIENYIAQQERQSQERERAAFMDKATRLENEITQFATATDSAGALLHPHFEVVKDDMAFHAQVMRTSGRQPVLSELYETAVRANPSTYAHLLEAERAAVKAQYAEAEKQRQVEARAKATQARRAAAPVTGAPGAGQSGAASNGSLRSQLETTFDEVTASV